MRSLGICENCEKAKASHSDKERRICSAELKERHKDDPPRVKPKEAILPDYTYNIRRVGGFGRGKGGIHER